MATNKQALARIDKLLDELSLAYDNPGNTSDQKKRIKYSINVLTDEAHRLSNTTHLIGASWSDLTGKVTQLKGRLTAIKNDANNLTNSINQATGLINALNAVLQLL